MYGSVALGLAAGLAPGSSRRRERIFVAYLRYQPISDVCHERDLFRAGVVGAAAGRRPSPRSLYLAYADSFLFIPMVASILIGGALIAR